MNKYILVFLLLGTLSFNCKKDSLKDENITTYTIAEDYHESDAVPKKASKKLSFKIKFDSTAIYTLDPIDQYDVNKLFGFNACNSHHQTNSARFGWRWLYGNLEIHAYQYENKQRIIAFLTNVKINEWNTYTLEDTGGSYIYTINDTSWVMSKPKCQTLIRYMLFPYFGGTTPAPHDVTIHFKK